MKIWAILNGFVGGEISPSVWGRTETDQWPMMVEEMRNCFPDPRGGAKRRGGTMFVYETKYPERETRLIPFIFSNEQSYMLEFGHYYVRFFRDSGWVDNLGTVETYLGDGSNAVFAYEHASVASGDIEVYVDGVLKTLTTDYTVTAIDTVTNQITDFNTPASWDADLDNHGASWTFSGNTASSPSEASVLAQQTALAVGANVRFTATFDSVDAGAGDWYVGFRDADDVEVSAVFDTPDDGLIDIHLQAPQDGKYLFSTDDGLQITISDPQLKYQNDGYLITFVSTPAVGETVIILDSTATAAGDTTGEVFEIQSPYAEDVLGDLYFAQANDVMVICDGLQRPRQLTRYGAYDWRFERKNYTGAPWEDGAYDPDDGYPRTVAFFQERLYFGGTVASPQTLWGSRAADFYDFTIPATPVADDPVEYTIAAYTHEAIEWLSSERVLVIGTSATEHRLAPDEFVATDRLPTVSRMSAYGGAHIVPAYMGNLTVFVQTATNQVRSYEQSSDTVIEKWDSTELDWVASHLTEGLVKEISYALNPNSLLYLVTEAGDLLSMTYEPAMGNKNIVGWAKHPSDGDFKSVAVIPNGAEHQPWVIIEREGARYVEYISEAIYTDSTLTYPEVVGDPAIQVVGGLSHLEGKTVAVKADGGTHPDVVVSGGQVTLNDFYSEIEIGLPFTPYIKLQRYSQAKEPANLQGMMGRWVDIHLRLVDSAYPLVNGVRAAERRPSTGMNNPEDPVTGDVRVFNLGHDRDKQLIISQDLPLPFHITAIFGIMEINQG